MDMIAQGWVIENFIELSFELVDTWNRYWNAVLPILTLWSQPEVFLRIHILCDLHIEFGDFVPPVVGADVVVLAGDVHAKNRGLQWIFDQKFEVSVLYVLGNHEFYREKFPGLIDKLKMGAEGTNVHVLENDSVEIGGYRFLGCTLWSDMELLGDPHVASIAAADAMNDYRLIRHSKTYRRLSPKDTRMYHFRSVRKLTEFLKFGEPEKVDCGDAPCPVYPVNRGPV